MICCGQPMSYEAEYEENPFPVTRVRCKCACCGRIKTTSVRENEIGDILIIELVEEKKINLRNLLKQVII